MSTAANLPPLPRDNRYTRSLSELVEHVNGFVYPGDRANAVVDTVKVLRHDPALARELLNNQPRTVDPGECHAGCDYPIGSHSRKCRTNEVAS